jgi:hypothetical protein
VLSVAAIAAGSGAQSVPWLDSSSSGAFVPMSVPAPQAARKAKMGVSSRRLAFDRSRVKFFNEMFLGKMNQ